MSTEILWFTLVMSAVNGLIAILSALVTGYLVFRTRKEQHETLFPAKREKRKGPIVIDDFATETMHDNDKGLPPIIKQMNERMGAELGISGLKKVK